ncbi:hypothetical protein M9H77_08734 [Catharanthus roseus]|uniref:Uncharacterized protein n=1 Tax=Catharanthus roseus TaxID=4058 RepID=A0ACC0BYU4_CATRO|nr:hypothetical protein M9H77_08734 [Catharanthus roseus]
MTRAQRKKLKLHEDNDMIAYKEETLKRKIEEFEGQRKLPKLFKICSIVKEQSREQFGPPYCHGRLAAIVTDRFLLASLGRQDPYCRRIEATKSSIEILHSKEALCPPITPRSVDDSRIPNYQKN